MSQRSMASPNDSPIDPAAGLPPLHELLAHSHLLTDRQRRQGSIYQVGPLFCVHAQGVRDGQPVAVDRFFAHASSPAATLLALRKYGPERDHLLFVVDAPAHRQGAFERAGFRVVETQWLMSCALTDWQPPRTARSGSAIVKRVTEASDGIRLSTINGLEPIPVDDLLDPRLSHYYVLAGSKPTTYGRSARYDETTGWVSHVHTAPQHRRQGYASALMEEVLTDSISTGITQSTLLATPMARSLYTRLGYSVLAPVAIMQVPSVLLRRGIRRS